MIKNLLLFTALVFSLRAFATDFPDDPSRLLGILSDSGIRGPAYAKIVDELNDIAKTYPEYTQVFTYGMSVRGRPLTLIKIARTDIEAVLPAVYVGGSIHGNEYLNIEDRLPRWFAEQVKGKGSVAKYIAAGGAIYVAPILNPDGYDNRGRENDNGVDLNRDFTVNEANVTGLTEPETASLIQFLTTDLLKSNRKLALALDYHCCIGALLYPWSFTGPKLSKLDQERHLSIARIMQKRLGADMRSGTTPVILGYSAKGTSKDFYWENFGALGFTFEGRRNKENQYFSQHTEMWAEIIAGILP